MTIVRPGQRVNFPPTRALGHIWRKTAHELRAGLVVRCAPEVLTEGASLGVLGGGQLGRMMGLAAANMGVKMYTLDPTPDCPASVAANQTVGDFNSKEDVLNFVRQQAFRILTVEIEHVNVDALEAAVQEGVEVQPTPQTIRIIQDKYRQKEVFQSLGVPLPPFMAVPDQPALDAAAKEFGYPLMLKARRLAYDGRGNALVDTEQDVEEAVARLGGFEQGLYVEGFVPFKMELAVMVARSRDGQVSAYPVVQTWHKDSICLLTCAPAEVPAAVRERAMAVASQAVQGLEGAGVFGVELFLLEDGQVLLNEVAPRPHNSGHYTIEACMCSQFEQHVRAVLGWPLGATAMKVHTSVMYNILGQADGEEGFLQAQDVAQKALATQGATLHWYQKAGVRRQRKIGHVTFAGTDLTQLLAPVGHVAGSEVAEMLQPREASPQVGIIMGSDSDLSVMSSAAEVCRDFNLPHELTIVSAHRTPDRLLQYARTAAARGIRVIIAGAGGAAHLPGMVAAMTPLPVVGVPIKPKTHVLDGTDALLSIVQMPKGVPVATVAINNAANAGLLAVRIVGAGDEGMRKGMEEYQTGMESTVLGKAQKLEAVGWEEYLQGM